MPRPRKSAALSTEQLAYLAGIYEATLGLRGVGTNGACGISNTEEWPQYMAATYGGNATAFTSNAGKTIWGWWVPIPRRLEITNLLKEAGVCKTLTIEDWDKVINKQKKWVDNLEYSDSEKPDGSGPVGK